MKIGVVGKIELIKELQAKFAGVDGIALSKFNSVDDLSANQMDVYFDLDFKMETSRIDSLSKLLPKPVFINAVINTLEEIGHPFIRINAWPTFLSRDICE